MSEKEIDRNDAASGNQTDSDAGNDSGESRAPELSLRSGLALAASALAYFCTVGFMNAYGVFQQYYTAEYLSEKSNFQISWIGSFATFALFAFALPAGFLTDRHGPTLPLCIGIVCQLIAIFMISLSREYYQFFLAQGVLLGIGNSLICIPTSTIVPLYFKRNRGLAQGVSIGGSSLGGILWPVAMDQLLNRDNVSFGWSMRIIGFVMIPLLALVLLLLRKPIEPEKSSRDTETGTEPKTKKKADLSRLRKPPYLFLCSGLAFAYFGFFAPLFFVPTYAVHIGFSENLAFYLVSILNGASLFGRILPGFIADRVGAFNIITISAFCSGIVVFLWTTATSIGGLVVWTAAYGFISGAIMSSQLVCATQLSDEHSRGAAIGLAFGSVSLTGLFGSPIAGELVESGYVALSCFAGAMLLLGGIMLALSRLSQEKKIWKVV